MLPVILTTLKGFFFNLKHTSCTHSGIHDYNISRMYTLRFNHDLRIFKSEIHFEIGTIQKGYCVKLAIVTYWNLMKSNRIMSASS